MVKNRHIKRIKVLVIHETLVQDLLAALKGNHVSESLPSEARFAMYQERTLPNTSSTLEDELVAALVKKRNLVVAGSAGGGKTMLIEFLLEKLREAKVDTSKIFVVQDLTAVPGNRSKILENGISQHEQYIVAANEGILRDPKIQKVLNGSWESMRHLQNGIKQEDTNSPIVVDVAGLDPLISLKGILLNDGIRSAIRLNEKECELNSEFLKCPRLAALDLLDEEMVDVVVEIIQSVFASGEITFRDLWNFVSDILLGGSCVGSFPDSAWFWRIFKGRTAMASKIDEKQRPEILPMIGITPFLFRGDWEFIQNKLHGLRYKFVDPGNSPQEFQSSQEANQLLTWFKVQMALILRASGMSNPRLLGESIEGLENLVLKHGRVEELTQAINGYFRRESRHTQTNSLQLWIDMGTERKSKRSKTLVGLGMFPKRDLEIVWSGTVGNLPDVYVKGTRAYLRSKTNQASSLELSTDFFEALQQGRPISTERRKFDDVDFALRKFFLNIYDRDEVEDSNQIFTLGTGFRDRNLFSAFRVLETGKVERVDA